MGHNNDKRYYEYLAKTILETFIPEQYSEIVLSDRPDLSIPGKLGIEVTKADIFSENKNYFRKYLDKKEKSEIDEKIIKNFEKRGNQIIFHPNGTIGGFLPPARWLGIDEIKNAYTAKKKKLANYPENIPIYLFIHSPSFNDYDIDDINKYILWINSQRDGRREYSMVYIYQEDVLYIINIISNELQVLPIDKNKLNMCCAMSKEYALS